MEIRHRAREAPDGVGRVDCLLDSRHGAFRLGLQCRQGDAGNQILLGGKPVDHGLLGGPEPAATASKVSCAAPPSRASSAAISRILFRVSPLLRAMSIPPCHPYQW
jgi:hypothetical protein